MPRAWPHAEKATVSWMPPTTTNWTSTSATTAAWTWTAKSPRAVVHSTPARCAHRPQLTPDVAVCDGPLAAGCAPGARRHRRRRLRGCTSAKRHSRSNINGNQTPRPATNATSQATPAVALRSRRRPRVIPSPQPAAARRQQPRQPPPPPIQCHQPPAADTGGGQHSHANRWPLADNASSCLTSSPEARVTLQQTLAVAHRQRRRQAPPPRQRHDMLVYKAASGHQPHATWRHSIDEKRLQSTSAGGQRQTHATSRHSHDKQRPEAINMQAKPHPAAIDSGRPPPSPTASATVAQTRAAACCKRDWQTSPPHRRQQRPATDTDAKSHSPANVRSSLPPRAGSQRHPPGNASSRRPRTPAGRYPPAAISSRRPRAAMPSTAAR